MKFKKLDDQNFLLYAIKHYDNPQCTGIDEFYQDLSAIIYLKRLFKKYALTGEIKEKLALNHVMLIYNVFGTEAATRILFWKIEKEYHAQLKTLIVFLKHLKENHNYKEWGLEMNLIPLDQKLVERLRGNN
jgi:hypothetical protein